MVMDLFWVLTQFNKNVEPPKGTACSAVLNSNLINHKKDIKHSKIHKRCISIEKKIFFSVYNLYFGHLTVEKEHCFELIYI